MNLKNPFKTRTPYGSKCGECGMEINDEECWSLEFLRTSRVIIYFHRKCFSDLAYDMEKAANR